MSGKEIAYVDFELYNHKGNLSKFYENWCDAPKPLSKTTAKSKGNVAKGENENCQCASNGSDAFLHLLVNSLGFFDSMGITYTEADEKCAEAIKKEGAKYNTEAGMKRKNGEYAKKKKAKVQSTKKKKAKDKKTKAKKIKGTKRDPWKDKNFESQAKKHRAKSNNKR